MQPKSPNNEPALIPSNLKKGWTTGACATAAAKAAYISLISGKEVAKVEITLPRGQQVNFDIERLEKVSTICACACVIKDAGDDPDVTHEAHIISSVKLLESGGVKFKAGKGIGTVTRPGLKLAPGEPAINPVPREMMTTAITEVAEKFNVPGHVEITISIPNGEELAKRTLNGRLGIVGGLSILGTTGIVKPYSCSAWIDSIYRGVDVAKACNIDHVAACTGSTSEKSVQEYFGLDDVAMLEMGDFVGALLKYIKKHPLPHITIGGGFAKMCKLATGQFNLHSKHTMVDFDWLSQQAQSIGADNDLVRHIVKANTALEVLEKCQHANIDISNAIANLSRQQVNDYLGGSMRVSSLIVDRYGVVIGKSFA